MKKTNLLLLLLVLALACIGTALAETTQTTEEAKLKELSKFKSYVYAELSLDEIPDGELTQEMLEMLAETHENQIFDRLLPWLVQRGYVQDLPRSAYLAYEGSLWTEEGISEYTVWDDSDLARLEEAPAFQVHLSPDCNPAATKKCNYFALYFWELETIVEPCPVCFPNGWVYEYLLTYAFEGMNQMEINLRTEAVSGKYDQPTCVIAYYDHATDECLWISVQSYGQDFAIVYQSDSLQIDGIVYFCPNCEEPWCNYVAAELQNPGLWYCASCGHFTKVMEDQ